jgi:hypothetical protein
MIPMPPAFQSVADSIPPALNQAIFALSLIGLVLDGVLLLWWKMHRIGPTFGEALAKAQTQAQTRVNLTRTAPPVYRPACIPAVWEDVAPADYRDDTATEPAV